MKKKTPSELPIIQKTYDLILWYVPILQRLPRDHRFMLGDRMIESLYEMLNELIAARYAKEKLAMLEAINVRLEQLRYKTRLLLDFGSQLVVDKAVLRTLRQQGKTRTNGERNWLDA